MILLHLHIWGGARISPPLSLCVLEADDPDVVVVVVAEEVAVVLVDEVVEDDVEEDALPPAVVGVGDGLAAAVWMVEVVAWVLGWLVGPFCLGDETFAAEAAVLTGGETFEARAAGLGLVPFASGSGLTFAVESAVLSEELVVVELDEVLEEEWLEEGNIPLLCISLYFSLCSIFKVR